jgi:glucose-6-phosphate 1-dehydrogenase
MSDSLVAIAWISLRDETVKILRAIRSPQADGCICGRYGRVWSIIDTIVSRLAANPAEKFPNCAAGSRGPEAAAALPGRDGRHWKPD